LDFECSYTKEGRGGDDQLAKKTDLKENTGKVLLERSPQMTRSTREVFESHKEAIEKMNFEQLAGDYAEDAILVTIDGSFVGKEAIMTGFFQAIMGQFPDVKIEFEKLSIEGDVCLLQWSAEASAVSCPRGTAVFIIQDGLIQRQGEWFEMFPKEG
jgi:ketosteroid isomerase-like protein